MAGGAAKAGAAGIAAHALSAACTVPDTARGADSGGFGLGLSIARTIVELHGGQIELTNRIPSGTRVVMTLPI